jgi:ATP-dependent DNA ligase
MDYGRNGAPLCLWAFDLLYLDGVRITPLKLVERKERLAGLIAAAGMRGVEVRAKSRKLREEPHDSRRRLDRLCIRSDRRCAAE